jgi:hypothetical protein
MRLKGISQGPLTLKEIDWLRQLFYRRLMNPSRLVLELSLLGLNNFVGQLEKE